MSKILHREIGKLEMSMLALSSLAEGNLHRAVKAVEERDRALATDVLNSDSEIDRLEVELEEACLKTLALHVPVAVDLRFIIAILKINNDLERVGDLATTIAKQALLLADRPEVDVPFDLHDMARRAWSMVRQSLDAIVRMDPEPARRVRVLDEDVDRLHRQNQTTIEEAIKRNTQWTDVFICYLSVSRSLERVGDHATNIAEDVLYLLEGQIVRHDHGAAGKPGSTTAPSGGNRTAAAAHTQP